MKKTREQILEDKFKKYGIRKGWIDESKQAVLDAMEEYAGEKMSDLDKFVSNKLMYKNEPTENPQYEDDGQKEGDIDNSIKLSTTLYGKINNTDAFKQWDGEKWVNVDINTNAWHDARKELPELNEWGESDEVLCLTRKFGFAQNRRETDTYEILWWDGKHWQNWDTEYFEDNPDYFRVVYWMYIPELNEDE